ncbi:efflux RND transporter permease subunit, partial [Pseudoalteromonas sp. S1649]|uniref:efflux RND transporter permease subunit n=1 Tax=Pseudoalteromonas sp. S1649 TaxID=579508 RepID=UPI00110B898B
WLVVLAASALVVGSLWMGSKLGSEFIPPLKEGDILVQAIPIPRTGVEQAVEMQKPLEANLMQYEQVQTVFGRTRTGDVDTHPIPRNVTDTIVI